MSESKTRAPRKDAFDHFLRSVDKLRPADEYATIQVKWAAARSTVDRFNRKHPRLKRKMGKIDIFVRPQLGRSPYQLDLLVRIPDGVGKVEMRAALGEVIKWRDALTDFQGRKEFDVFGASFEKRSDGYWDFKCDEPLIVSNRANGELRDLLRDALFHEDDTPPKNPPYNTAWCLNEAQALLVECGVLNPERVMKQELRKLRAGEPAFEVVPVPRHNGLKKIVGPITAQIIKKRIKAMKGKYRRRMQLPLHRGHVKISK